jgi:tetratricopeptide (TPR) repeat protein
MIVILAIAAFGAEAHAQQSEAQCGSADLTAEQRMHICSAETEATQDLVVMPPSPLAPKAALFNQGAAQLKLKDYGHAIASFSEAIKLDPRHAAALNGRGFAYEATGQHDRAITDYSLAIAIDPLLVEALLNRGAAYRNKGRHDAALQDFDRALTLNPKSTAALFGRALVYQD